MNSKWGVDLTFVKVMVGEGGGCVPVKSRTLAIKGQLPYAGAVGIEPSLDEVPQLPVRREQQRVLVQQRLA